MVKTYQLKQQFRLGGERFEIRDQQGRIDYRVEGSFFKLPKTFTIFGADGQEVSRISKELLAFLPRFTVTLADGQAFTIRKQLTFFCDRYEFDNLPLVVEGNIWDWDFILKDQAGQEVAQISKEVFRLFSTYQLTVLDETYTDLVVSLAVAIDYVEMLESSS